MAKNILILQAESSARRGAHALDMSEMYRQMKKGRNYKVCVFGQAFKGVPKDICIKRSEIYRNKFDAIILNSLKDVMYVKTYRLFHRKGSTKYIYVDRDGLLGQLMAVRLKKLLPRFLVRWNLFLNMSAWLDHYIAVSAEEQRYAAEHFDGMGTKVHVLAHGKASAVDTTKLAEECRRIIERG